ncbi:adhesion G-protein coupled receptor G6-like [Pagrus major]|uniref:adhesion G-protein coupled receptor G6-like n=1 Tax=Pagrus major TaxID=143350 RepID=UPI003CC8B859
MIHCDHIHTYKTRTARRVRRMYDLGFERQRRWTRTFPLVIWLWLLAATSPRAVGYFLADTKAVLNGCEDHWTLQDRAAMPLLFQMTVCVDIRVVVPGAWVAFSYSSVHAPRPELGLEGDDEALYGWLLRVRHRFPLQLFPQHWHRVCLRRDVRRNSFSLEVNGNLVAERTVIARAIPPSGTLWLGCRPRDRPPGAVLGKVELYLFRMWPDVGHHGLCEDGTVIGWNAKFWGMTSPEARQRDPYLLCEVPSTPTTSSPVIATPPTHMRNQKSQLTGAYFWMSISVTVTRGSKTEQDVKNLVSNVFGCHNQTGFMDFCRHDRQLQVEEVNCKEQNNIRNTTCDVLLQLSHAVSACELQRAGVSALQQAGDGQIQAEIIGEVERVARDLCEGVDPSGGGFVRCTSTSSSLDDICKGNKHSSLTWLLIWNAMGHIRGTETTLTTTAETTQSQEEQEEQANELLSQTQDTSQFNSSQVAQLTQQLEKLLDGPTVSQAVGQKAISVISNLMGGDSVALSESANRLIRLVDDVGLKLVVIGDSAIASSNSLVLAVTTVDGTNFPTTSVDIFNTDNVQLRALSTSRSKRSGSALGSVFLPSSLTSGLSPEQQQQASRVQFTFYTTSALFQDSSLDNQTIVSPVLGSSVANLSISNLAENIQFTIRNINPITVNVSASCAFWDFALNGGRGGWSTTGCFVVNATQEDTTCSCNHLTAFAILLDLSREGLIDRQQAQILTFITYIGCGISAIFLSVTLLTYLCFEKLLRDIPAKILVQLCMSLLLMNLVFLLDGWLALYPAVGLCISTAFFLHYFLLTSFTWAGLEALHMYLSVVQVFTPYLSRYMLKFSLVGWGIPLLVVIVVISVDKDNYGLVTYGRYTDGTTDDFCWLRNDIAFYVGVVAYFLLIFCLCLLVFILVMVQLARIKKQNPQNQSPNRGVMTDMRSIAGLVILLGLTWGFALFAWGPLYLPFVYLFTIFNTLQGFLVFVFHCAVKENVRRQWRTYLCCGKLRLAENSEWSRTATQNKKNLSLNTATTRALHSTSRSSSVISDATNSSGSVFADSGISEGSGSDVVLNEIHRRNMSLSATASGVHASIGGRVDSYVIDLEYDELRTLCVPCRRAVGDHLKVKPHLIRCPPSLREAAGGGQRTEMMDASEVSER